MTNELEGGFYQTTHTPRTTRPTTTEMHFMRFAENAFAIFFVVAAVVDTDVGVGVGVGVVAVAKSKNILTNVYKLAKATKITTTTTTTIQKQRSNFEIDKLIYALSKK